uniref:Tryptophyllin-T2-9 n=1 Tax=Pithecopus azureus TaxID=2034991 RepID=TY29_PITAZ|nr:RecName: Full=Tryptophyllin-T2-9; Short=Pha-T2-9; AltName: Full=Tryptophyllin-4 [Pithecopus azureus]
VPPIGWF